MRVQRVLTRDSTVESWTLMGNDLRPVGPVESFLAYISSVERSPNTVKAYAHDLKGWWTYLDGRGLDWRTVNLEVTAGFVAWLRLPPPACSGAVAVLPRRLEAATERNRQLEAENRELKQARPWHWANAARPTAAGSALRRGHQLQGRSARAEKLMRGHRDHSCSRSHPGGRRGYAVDEGTLLRHYPGQGLMMRSTVITQGVKITTRCEACGGVLILDTGQFIERGRLWWGTEGACQSCPVAWCEQDFGDATPEAIRQALLAEHGPARLRLLEAEARPVRVLRALREVHGLSLAQARGRADELKTAGLLGTFVEIELAASRLRHHSVGVTVETSSG